MFFDNATNGNLLLSSLVEKNMIFWSSINYRLIGQISRYTLICAIKGALSSPQVTAADDISKPYIIWAFFQIEN